MFADLASPRLLKGLSRLLAAVAVSVCSVAAHAVPVTGQGTWETTLKARDINSDGIVDAYYDTALNISWLADWNITGPINWDTAVAWANGLNLYGVTGWRLPNITDIGNDGCNLSFAGGTDCGYNVDTASSEMAHMFYVTLGNLGACPAGDTTCAGFGQPGFGLTNTADFLNMQSKLFSLVGYWSGTGYLDPNNAWFFNTTYGLQDWEQKWVGLYAVAVHSGDVPEPATLALLVLGLAGLGFSRRRKA